MSDTKRYFIETFSTPFLPLQVAIDSSSAKVVASGFSSTNKSLNKMLSNTELSKSSKNSIHQTCIQIKHFLERYFAKDLSALDPSEFLSQLQGTPFQIQVWNEIRNIPFGTTNTYGDIAHSIGRPKAFRATGNACGANRLAPFIPCHRVLPSSGSAGNYKWGSDVKMKLLAHEALVAKNFI